MREFYEREIITYRGDHPAKIGNWIAKRAASINYFTGLFFKDGC